MNLPKIRGPMNRDCSIAQVVTNDASIHRRKPHYDKQVRQAFKETDTYTVYENGIEKEVRNEGIHPRGHRIYFTIDEKTIEECLAWWTKPEHIRDG